MSSEDNAGVFEIREYLDEDGSIRERTVIDISKEHDLIRKTQLVSDDDNSDETKNLTSLLKLLSQSSNHDCELNEDDQFIRELSMLSSSGEDALECGYNNSFLTTVPGPLPTTSAIESTPVHRSAKSTGDGPNGGGSKGGWSKGFLNKSKRSPKTADVQVESNSLPVCGKQELVAAAAVAPIKEPLLRVAFSGQIVERLAPL